MRVYNIDPVEKEFSWGKAKVLALGEEGRGRVRTYVLVAGDFNPEADDFTIEKVKNAVVLKRGSTESGWIIRINTYCCYTRNTHGRFEVYQGNVKTVVEGYGAFGDAGNIGGWVDAVVVVKPPYPAVIRVKPSGGYKAPAYYLVVFEDHIDKVEHDEKALYEVIKGISLDPPKKEEEVER